MGAPGTVLGPDGILSLVRNYVKMETPGVLGDPYRKGSI